MYTKICLFVYTVDLFILRSFHNIAKRFEKYWDYLVVGISSKIFTDIVSHNMREKWQKNT